MNLSVRLATLSPPFAEALHLVAALGFTHADIPALSERPDEHLEALAQSGLIVAAAELSATGLDGLKSQVVDAARIGATIACLATTLENNQLLELADYAGRRMVQLCTPPAARACANVGWILDWGSFQLRGDDALAAVSRRPRLNLVRVPTLDLTRHQVSELRRTLMDCSFEGVVSFQAPADEVDAVATLRHALELWSELLGSV